MSWNVDLFFNAHRETDAVVDALEQLWQVTFRKDRDESREYWRLEVLRMLIYFYDEHDFVNDAGLSFSDYKYWLSIGMFGETDWRRSFARGAALLFAHQIYEQFGWECIAVERSQILLLRLPEQPPE
jgi:hypothetical protein